MNPQYGFAWCYRWTSASYVAAYLGSNRSSQPSSRYSSVPHFKHESALPAQPRAEQHIACLLLSSHYLIPRTASHRATNWSTNFLSRQSQVEVTKAGETLLGQALMENRARSLMCPPNAIGVNQEVLVEEDDSGSMTPRSETQKQLSDAESEE
ncbi:hypothetical protein EJ02DRAFT_258324 [Clathrospora elynae]|uniref:Uncharacterized protein n=1 Tax=Clathrospora elynae TaxID=706981 RepID=A0A6A5SLD1_9PLEO|nr:hypothetical protein EJ02DRAFT_258324 [Clathrospora elynae]